MFNFERLEAWQKSIDFADFVYTVTREFPDDEQFGLTSQTEESRQHLYAAAEEQSRMLSGLRRSLGFA